MEPSGKTSGKKIAIIGGGISGLYAAWLLLRDDLGHQVDVFESSDRFGGRILSQKIPQVAGPAELGAMRFKLAHQKLCALLKDLRPADDPKTYPDFAFNTLYYLRGSYFHSTRVLGQITNKSSGNCPEEAVGEEISILHKQALPRIQDTTQSYRLYKVYGDEEYGLFDEQSLGSGGAKGRSGLVGLQVGPYLPYSPETLITKGICAIFRNAARTSTNKPTEEVEKFKDLLKFVSSHKALPALDHSAIAVSISTASIQ